MAISPWFGRSHATLPSLIKPGPSRLGITRAGLESIALQVRDLLEAMNRDSGVTLDELRVHGGAWRNNLLLRIQADLLDVAVVRPTMIETSAFGAACLAGLATGLWRDQSELEPAEWRHPKLILVSFALASVPLASVRSKVDGIVSGYNPACLSQT